jgi:hypothetical protein
VRCRACRASNSHPGVLLKLHSNFLWFVVHKAAEGLFPGFLNNRVRNTVGTRSHFSSINPCATGHSTVFLVFGTRPRYTFV